MQPIMFTPKYRGRVLVGDMALVAGAVIRRICEEMDFGAIDMAVNPDHVAMFIKCLPKYSASYLSKMIKRRSSRELKKISPLKGMVWKSSMGTKLLSWLCGEWMECCREVYFST